MTGAYFTVHCLSRQVLTSECANLEPSDYRTVGLSNRQTIEPSDYRSDPLHFKGVVLLNNR
jgi:hypothetical protein